MKMQTSAGQLRSALGAFRGIIERRNTIPVLGTVKLEGGQLVGTNLDSEVSVRIASTGPMEGSACVDWFALSSLAGHIDDDEPLTVSDQNNLTTVSFNGSAYEIGSLPIEDFPTFKAAGGPRTEAGNLGLVAAMNRIRFAMSSEETRYYLNGVAIVNDADGKPMLAATTGHQLAMMPLDVAPEGSVGAIIPRQIVHYLCQRKAEPNGCVFDRDAVRARFDFAGMVLSTKLIDGTFPDILRVIPKAPAKLFSVERVRLMRALARIRAFSGGPFKGVKLAIADDTLTLTMRTGERTATEVLAVTGEGVAPTEAGFNVDYLLSVLGGFRGDVATFAAEAPFSSNPTVITTENDPLTVMQMPMRV